MDKLKIIKRLQESDLNKEIVFHYDTTTKNNDSSSSIKKLQVVSNYDCIDYIEVRLDDLNLNSTRMKVKDLIFIIFSDIMKDIKLKYKGKEVEIKDIITIDSPITPIGVIVLLEKPETN